jgi:hypothetical protein
MDLFHVSFVNNNNNNAQKVVLHMCSCMLIAKKRKEKEKERESNRCLFNRPSTTKYFGLFPMKFHHI